MYALSTRAVLMQIVPMTWEVIRVDVTINLLVMVYQLQIQEQDVPNATSLIHLLMERGILELVYVTTAGLKLSGH